ncbi:MAG: T9SS type A sorting domain-containing protein [Chloroherpetonaceae bacterium]|nr:T9SS type A sorting domain-containing protein [Chloroherpetonaceae bacterium]MDW8437947.1 T9SS type A sorting domain-containing protein [Chloroherpetonaceae bacterium]
MKKTLTAFVLLFAAATYGQTIFYEPFNGTGNLNGSNGWVNHSGTTNQIQYETSPSDLGANLSYPGLPAPQGNRIRLDSTQSEDLNKEISPAVTDSVYASFLLKVRSATSLQPNDQLGAYFAHFIQGAGATPGTIFVGRVHIKRGSAPGTFNLGILNTAGGTQTVAGIYGTSPQDYLVGQTYFVVFKYNRLNNTATLWVNPSLGQTTEPPPTHVNNTGTSAPPSQMASLAVRNSNSAGVGTGNLEIDEIRVSRSWAEVSLPVELVSFAAQLTQDGVWLSWRTASELNNAGFNVERKMGNADWTTIGFVRGNGTTTQAQSYSFLDRTASGKVQYRLKQVDFDGRFEYSNVIEVDAGLPKRFVLEQNYPNPFNPSTTIAYQLPVASDVKLEVFDMLGKKVATLVSGRQEAGAHSANFNASALSSGIYFYRLQAGGFAETKKMTLAK